MSDNATSGSRLGTEDRPLRVAVVGSGPSGFYAAAGLFKHDELTVQVDMFDRLPTPFGLVRGGVAPDHQKIKNVIRVYDKTAAHEGFRFFGNVQIGRDLSVEELARFYDQIVFAVGNESDRKMGLPGEDLEGVYSATEFVGWYNGHPDFQDRQFDLTSARRVAVVGNGNVAMDVTRILAQNPDQLASTDITDEALRALRSSAVEEVVVLGRRGPAQSAFSTKEIKEIGALEDCDLIIDPADVEVDEVTASWLASGAEKSAQRNLDYLTEAAQLPATGGRCRVRCRFLVSPTEFHGDDGKLQAVTIEHNELYPDEDGTPRPRGNGKTERLEVQLVFKAVGYRGVALPGVPFDDRWGVFPNDEGRLLDSVGGDPVIGQYVVGWAKRGPSGLIGTNGPDSEATVARMVEDLEAGRVSEAVEPDVEAIAAFLSERGIDSVSYRDWTDLDTDEISRGESQGKVREKYTTVQDMMHAVGRLRSTRGSQ